MRKIITAVSAVAMASAAVAYLGGAAQAAVVQNIKVGTWSTPLGAGANPGGFAQGGKYVIISTHETNDIVAVPAGRNGFTLPGFHVPLTGGDNTFEVFIPMEGLNTIATQTEADHFFIGPGFAPAAEIQFFDAAGTKFRGYEFESQFLAGGHVYSEFTADVTNTSGLGDQLVTNRVADMRDVGFAITTRSVTSDVLSVNQSAFGGSSGPGVFLSDAVPVVGEAGPNLAYDAGTLSVTTDGGTATVSTAAAPITPSPTQDVGGTNEPIPGSEVVRDFSPVPGDDLLRHQDNDLGAARSDGEDFLNFSWSLDGGAFIAANQTGTRINRIIDTMATGFPRFANSGMRTVDDVNVTVSIAASGLLNTTDTVQFELAVTEDITNIVGSNDTTTVSYTNAAPMIVSATGVEQPDFSFDFAGVFDDPDLVVNALIPGFETLTNVAFTTAANFGGNTILSGVGTTLNGNVSRAALEGLLGADATGGMFTVFANVQDFAGAIATAPLNITLSNTAMVAVPEPSGLALFVVGLVTLGGMARRRRAASWP